MTSVLNSPLVMSLVTSLCLLIWVIVGFTFTFNTQNQYMQPVLCSSWTLPPSSVHCELYVRIWFLAGSLFSVLFFTLPLPAQWLNQKKKTLRILYLEHPGGCYIFKKRRVHFTNRAPISINKLFCILLRLTFKQQKAVLKPGLESLRNQVVVGRNWKHWNVFNVRLFRVPIHNVCWCRIGPRKGKQTRTRGVWSACMVIQLCFTCFVQTVPPLILVIYQQLYFVFHWSERLKEDANQKKIARHYLV